MFKDLPEGETHCDINEELKQRALEMYKAPFEYKSVTRNIMDSTGFIVVTVYGLYPDINGELIAAALNDFWRNHGNQIVKK